MKKLILTLTLISAALFSTGCIQEALVVPVATITGQIIVPAGKVATGVQVTIAGDSGHTESTYADENGDFSLEVKKSGRYLIFARGRHFDINYQWVDAKLEKTVTMSPIVLDEKIVGEALWMATTLDYSNGARSISLKPENPSWATDTYQMYDDGTHGDKLANDGIFSLRMSNLTTGSQLYSLVVTDVDGKVSTFADPHQESERLHKSEIIIPESTVKLARGKVTSDLVGVNYSEVKLATKKGSRAINLDSDGSYNMSMEGNGKEYLVFRSPSFDIKAIPVDLTTVPVYDVPTTTLSVKKGGQVKLILIKTDFAQVTDPVVVADFTSWQPQQMYDDATHGDEVAGDGVYTRTFTGIAPGYHKYAFNITETNQVRDPYQESGDSQYSIILVK